jgi:glutamate racemase
MSDEWGLCTKSSHSPLITYCLSFIVHHSPLIPMSYPIGVFDSGYGGLTILSKIKGLLPEYDYLYLGDNARAPYGTRSFEVVYEFTLQAVSRLFEEGCRLVILACNTASAKALRTIQQIDLSRLDSQRRVLGIIRPTVEVIGNITHTRHVGIVGTPGTIASESYPIEIRKIHPDIVVSGEACPMWVPLVENLEYDKPGADYFVEQHIRAILSKDALIDTLALACTHYPLLEEKIRMFLPGYVRIVSQGEYVAASLKDYLHRHPEIEEKCSKNATVRFYTTESENKFKELASIFLKKTVTAERISLRE